MVIIGITGPICHGKTSFGKALQKLEPRSVHYESFQVIASLASTWLNMSPQLPKPNDIAAINDWLQKLVPVLNQEFGVNATFLDVKIDEAATRSRPDQYQKLFEFLAQEPTQETAITEENKEYFRPLMQWMGAYFVAKIDFGIWYKKILRQIKIDETKGASLATVGGLRFPQDAVILKEAGATIVLIERPNAPTPDEDDPTERQRRDIMTDTSIVNNGNLLDLEACAQRFYSDLKQGQLKPSYSAV
jgi:hypothetical protein